MTAEFQEDAVTYIFSTNRVRRASVGGKAWTQRLSLTSVHVASVKAGRGRAASERPKRATRVAIEKRLKLYLASEENICGIESHIETR